MAEYTVFDDDRPYTRSLALFLTKRCPLRCAHCGVGSSPEADDPPAESVVRYATGLAASERLEHVCLTGGEPFLRPTLLRRVVGILAAGRKDVSVITSAYWARSERTAHAMLAAVFTEARPFRLWISIDRYHSEFIRPQRYAHAVDAAWQLGIPVCVSATYARQRHEAAACIAAALPDAAHRQRLARVKYQPLFGVGRAAPALHASAAAEPALPRGLCASCVGHVNADGDVIACCSTFDATPGHPLHLGHLASAEVDVLLARSSRDWLIQAVRVLGPSRLAKAAGAYLPASLFERTYLRHDICAVCDALMKTPAAVSYLRTRLAPTRRLARQVARLRAILYGEFDSLMWLQERRTTHGRNNIEAVDRQSRPRPEVQEEAAGRL